MFKRAAWTLGLVAGLSSGIFAETPPQAPATGLCYEQRLTAMEKELEELKLGQAESTAKSSAPGTFRAFWDKTLKFETADKSVTIRLGGRINWDSGFITQDDRNKKKFGTIPDGTEFRRIRIETEGGFYTNTYWKFQVDFGGGKTELKDVLIGQKGIPLFGNVQVGHFNEPFSLEEVTSDKYDLFLEYSLPVQAFAPARNAGIMFFDNWRERVTWQAGVFRETDDSGILGSNSGYAATGRVTALPWYAEEGRKLLHVGAAFSSRHPSGDAVTYETRPEWHQSSRKFVSTGAIKGVDSANLLGLEGALVYGPFCAQAEYFNTGVSRTSGGDASFSGWYLEGSYFLTGENRKYDPKKGEFGRPIPNRNFNLKDGGLGAWELVARYSTVDLNDAGAGISGGAQKDTTLGLNWYLNPNTRVMFNWVHAMTDQPDNGNADMFLVRFQVDF